MSTSTMTGSSRPRKRKIHPGEVRTITFKRLRLIAAILRKNNCRGGKINVNIRGSFKSKPFSVPGRIEKTSRKSTGTQTSEEELDAAAEYLAAEAMYAKGVQEIRQEYKELQHGLPGEDILRAKYPNAYIRLVLLRGSAERLAVDLITTTDFITRNCAGPEDYVSVWDGVAHGPFATAKEAIQIARAQAKFSPCVPMTWKPNSQLPLESVDSSLEIKGQRMLLSHIKTAFAFRYGEEVRRALATDDRPCTPLILKSILQSEAFVRPLDSMEQPQFPIALFDSGCQCTMLLTGNVFASAADNNINQPALISGSDGKPEKTWRSPVKMISPCRGDFAPEHPPDSDWREVYATLSQTWTHPYQVMGPSCILEKEDFVLLATGAAFFVEKESLADDHGSTRQLGSARPPRPPKKSP